MYWVTLCEYFYFMVDVLSLYIYMYWVQIQDILCLNDFQNRISNCYWSLPIKNKLFNTLFPSTRNAMIYAVTVLIVLMIYSVDVLQLTDDHSWTKLLMNPLCHISGLSITVSWSGLKQINPILWHSLIYRMSNALIYLTFRSNESIDTCVRYLTKRYGKTLR